MRPLRVCLSFRSVTIVSGFDDEIVFPPHPISDSMGVAALTRTKLKTAVSEIMMMGAEGSILLTRLRLQHEIHVRTFVRLEQHIMPLTVSHCGGNITPDRVLSQLQARKRGTRCCVGAGRPV